MSTTLSRSKKAADDPPVPYTLRLLDGRTVFVEVPSAMIRYDRDGSLGFTLAGVRFLDRVRAMAQDIPGTPTPGQIVALREALGLTQQQLGEKMGVNKLTVSRWERGDMVPAPASAARLNKLRQRAAAQGVIVPQHKRSR